LLGEWRERVCIHKVNVAMLTSESDRAEAIHGLGSATAILELVESSRIISAVMKTLDASAGLIVVEYDESNAKAGRRPKRLPRTLRGPHGLTVPVPKERLGASGAVRVVNTPVAGRAGHAPTAGSQREEGGALHHRPGRIKRSDTSGMGTTIHHDAGNKSDLIEEDAGELDETLTARSASGTVYLLKKYTYPWADFPVRHVLDSTTHPSGRWAWSDGLQRRRGLRADEVRELSA